MQAELTLRSTCHKFETQSSFFLSVHTFNESTFSSGTTTSASLADGGNRSLVDLVLSVHSEHRITMDVNSGQFSGDIHPLGSEGFLGGDAHSVVDEIGCVHTNNDSVTRGNPLQFTVNLGPLKRN